jgi:tripartite-type tricarboxylate transporter receptor subunit TctC
MIFRNWLVWMRNARAAAALVILALIFAMPTARAEGYPDKAIHLIVPYPAGGGIDVVARIFQKKLGDILGQQIIIENHPGASGAVGAQFVAKAEPDGYTLLFCASDFISIPQLMPDMAFDPMKDLLPIAMVTNSPMVLAASADAPFDDFKQFLNVAKASPKGLTYATPGQGTLNNVVGQWIAVSAQIKLLPVAYHGGAAAAEGVAAGDVPLGILQAAAVYPALVAAGKAKIIALTGAKRPDFVPATWPTLAESGIPIDATLWLGLFASQGTPDAVVSRIDQAIGQIVQDPDIRQRMHDVGISPEHVGAASFAEKIRGDAARYDAVIRQAGMHFD